MYLHKKPLAFQEMLGVIIHFNEGPTFKSSLELPKNTMTLLLYSVEGFKFLYGMLYLDLFSSVSSRKEAFWRR
jgi:hypothetical protein